MLIAAWHPQRELPAVSASEQGGTARQSSTDGVSAAAVAAGASGARVPQSALHPSKFQIQCLHPRDPAVGAVGLPSTAYPSGPAPTTHQPKGVPSMSLQEGMACAAAGGHWATLRNGARQELAAAERSSGA